ncbi:MAG TPA: recombinase RecA [Candidatus Merdivicinus excrementipullorum]|uniref:Protein RecA n=1 Tax=Candidatus Merdivicinus excrementipullorum TaxID=2840867 RepID=A0A9D1FNP0_9FIRM|nr:recombinase RecA [Candidatus Merdivicinus excrementipullorum]
MAKAKVVSPVKQLDTPEEKKKALQSAIEHIEKTFGAGSIMKLGENRHLDVDVIPTGSLGLDLALGVGGVPKGRIVEIYGPESSGKTTVALQMVAQAQKMGGEAAFIDVEHALDPGYAKALGVDIDSLLVSQPDTGEQALEIAEALVRSGALDIVVFDSVAAMVTKAEIEGEMGDAHVGQLARLMSQAMRKLTAIIGRSNCVAIFINQIREKIGVTFGNPETTTGGRALKYFATVRIDVRKGESIKDGSEFIGNVTKCKVVKNKVAPPFKECTFDLMYGEGTSYEGEIIDIGSVLGLIEKSGSWYSYKGERIGQGKEKARAFLKEHPEVSAEIEKIIRDNIDNFVMAPAKGSKQSTLELRKGTTIKLGDEVITPPEHAPVSDYEGAEDPETPSSADDLTDIDLDVEADLDDFEE